MYITVNDGIILNLIKISNNCKLLNTTQKNFKYSRLILSRPAYIVICQNMSLLLSKLKAFSFNTVKKRIHYSPASYREINVLIRSFIRHWVHSPPVVLSIDHLKHGTLKIVVPSNLSIFQTLAYGLYQVEYL